MGLNQKIILIAGSCLSLMFVAVNVKPETEVPSPLPHHNISISFDLSNHRLYGTGDAIVPHTVTAMTVSEELMIPRLNIDGKPADATVKAGLLPLAPHPDQTRVHLQYEGVFAESDPKADSGIIVKKEVADGARGINIRIAAPPAGRAFGKVSQ